MRDFVMRELVYEILFARFCLRDIHRIPFSSYMRGRELEILYVYAVVIVQYIQSIL